jgi:hypothetical protein
VPPLLTLDPTRFAHEQRVGPFDRIPGAGPGLEPRPCRRTAFERPVAVREPTPAGRRTSGHQCPQEERPVIDARTARPRIDRILAIATWLALAALPILLAACNGGSGSGAGY